MKVLVTGAAGFIGSHLCDRLLGNDCSVVGLDNFNEFYDPQVKRSNILGCLQNAKFALVEGDIRDGDLVRSLFAEHEFDVIVHLAAMAGVRPSIVTSYQLFIPDSGRDETAAADFTPGMSRIARVACPTNVVLLSSVS